MIFVGDIAIGDGDRFCHDGFPDELKKVPWCLNLEGPVSGGADVLTWGVCNSSDWRETFRGFCLGPVFLGNNHIGDLPNGVLTTIETFGRHGLTGFGAGRDLEEARKPAWCQSNGLVYCLIGAGWPVVDCESATATQAGVNPLDGVALRQQVRGCLKTTPQARLIVVLHWNYEFELFPQPGHRRLAFDLVDDGAYAVIGHHPHVVGPVERYKGRTIAYSIGNWAFSYGHHFGGKLRFPESSFAQLAVEFGKNGTVAHHARFTPPRDIVYSHSEAVDSSDFSLAPVFEGFSHAEYMKWFCRHRVKREGLPVYRDYRLGITNRAKDGWVRLRQRAIDMAVKGGLKSLRRKGKALADS